MLGRSQQKGVEGEMEDEMYLFPPLSSQQAYAVNIPPRSRLRLRVPLVSCKQGLLHDIRFACGPPFRITRVAFASKVG